MDENERPRTTYALGQRLAVGSTVERYSMAGPIAGEIMMTRGVIEKIARTSREGTDTGAEWEK